MALDFFGDYICVTVLGLCLCLGYIIKTSLDFVPNKYIPLIMGVFGVVVSVWNSAGFTIESVLCGMVSGLASTGLYESFKNLINKGEVDEDDN